MNEAVRDDETGEILLKEDVYKEKRKGLGRHKQRTRRMGEAERKIIV